MKQATCPSPARTSLYDLHLELGARMVNFAGWMMPLHYATGILDEHAQCRERAALFDVSHMGQIELRGDTAAVALERLVPSDIAGLKPGRARYTMLTNETGGIRDDLIVANAGDHITAVVNASMRNTDTAHLRENLGDVTLVERTDRALIAVQGPASGRVVSSITSDADDLKFMETVATDILDATCRLSRLGYTGEDGFEISIPADCAVDVARALLAHADCLPAGLGARDSLRLEAGLCLYGSDIDVGTSPVEAQLQWVIQRRRRSEGGFPGAGRILKELENGPSRHLTGLKPKGRAPARGGTQIQALDGKPIGVVTSGGFGPTIGGPVSMGYIASPYAEPGTDVELLVRGIAIPAAVVALPFVPHNFKR